MAIVHVPSPLRELTGGESTVAVAGETVAEIVDRLEARFPGLRSRLVEDGKLRAGLTVFVDGEDRRAGLRARVGESSEVYFVHAMGGGAECRVPPTACFSGPAGDVASGRGLRPRARTHLSRQPGPGAALVRRPLPSTSPAGPRRARAVPVRDSRLRRGASRWR